MLISENQRPTEVLHHDQNGCTMESIKYSFPQRYDESYKGALEHFYDLIKGKQNVTLQDIIVEKLRHIWIKTPDFGKPRQPNEVQHECKVHYSIKQKTFVIQF
jgi:hypothetical protein